MQPVSVESEIRELEQIRKQARAWRLGATLGALLITVGCVALMNNAVQGLFRAGPKQDQFVAAVSKNLTESVVPQVQSVAMRTLQDSQPIVQAEFGKLNERVPDVTEAAVKEFEALQTQLPQRAEKVLDENFSEMLKGKEAKIKEMFPEATDAKIQAFVNNMTDEGHTRLSNINRKLFSPHIQAMSAIAFNMTKIETQEAPHLKGEIPTWQMGLLFFDVARADMKDVAMPGLDAPAKPGSKKPAVKPKTGVKAGVKPAMKAPAKPAAARGY